MKIYVYVKINFSSIRNKKMYCLINQKHNCIKNIGAFQYYFNSIYSDLLELS